MFDPKLKPAQQFEALEAADTIVTLHLRGNHTFKGKLTSWSDDFVVLTGVGGDSTHDVLVRVDDIAAIAAVVR